MQQQFLQLRERYHVAAVFVTHDLLEALAIGSRIAVLDCGKLELLTTPDKLFAATTRTARAFLRTLPAEVRTAATA
jgi:osmoprotectant transport system ATP-binding protein